MAPTIFQETDFTQLYGLNFAPVMMGRVLKVAGIDEDPMLLIIYFMGEGVDPNVNRERLLSPWVKAANSQALNTTD